MKRIPEEYIHYIWQYGLFDHQELSTADGSAIEIIHRGFHNHHAGPDFSNVRLRIGPDEWVGHIEIHFKSSDWNSHSHQHDPAYDNVILHLVFLHDKEIYTSKGGAIPTLSLSKRFSIDHFKKYETFVQSKNWVACEQGLKEVPSIKVLSLKERMCAERLEDKSSRFLQEMERNQGDLEQALFTTLAMALGGKVNAEPFRILAYNTPLEVIGKHSDDGSLLEALFLGQAGLLSLLEPDEHCIKLKKDYDFLSHKYGLQAMNATAWKNAPVRPSSAPALRIVQLSRLYGKKKGIAGFMLEAEIKDLRSFLEIEMDGYWSEHHSLTRKSKTSRKRIGQAMQDILMINVVAVLRYAYGRIHGEQSFKDSAVSLLEEIGPEDNAIIRKWDELGLGSSNAFDSQALLQLKKQHCDLKDCLRCIIGREILR